MGRPATCDQDVFSEFGIWLGRKIESNPWVVCADYKWVLSFGLLGKRHIKHDGIMSRCNADIITNRERRQIYAFFCVWLAILGSLCLGSWKWYHCFQNKEREQHHCWWCQIFQAIYTPGRCLQQGEGTALYWYNIKYTFKYNISLSTKLSAWERAYSAIERASLPAGGKLQAWLSIY